MAKRTIADRVNDYLAEPAEAQFVNNKWKFWFVAVAFLSVINATLTWLIFVDDAENYSGPIMLSVGTLVAWLCVCALHYTDGGNRQLARSVSVVDSVALLFVVVHFSGLLYVYGHHRTLRAAEARYEARATAYNAKADKLSDDNVKIAESARQIATETTKAEKLRNDTAYQQRKAAEAGGRLPAGRSTSSIGAGLATSQIELERPVKPAESSAAFLTKWDWLIRAANCGELLLACLTLILIRNVSAKTNQPVEIFVPTGTDFSTRAYRSPFPAPVGNFTTKKEPSKNHGSFSSRGQDADLDDDPPKNHGSFNSEGLKRLREALKDISFRLHNHSFKSAVRGDAVWIYLMKANHGTQEAVASAKAKLSLLDDAMRMNRTAFRERLERFLIENGFDLGGEHGE